MPKHSIFLASSNPKAVSAITAYFSDTSSIPSISRSKADLGALFSSTPEFVFLQGDWLDVRLSSRILQLKEELPKTKFFSLGEPKSQGFNWDGTVEFPIEEKNLRKVVLAKVEYPNPTRLLVATSLSKLITTVKDYFETRKNPIFQIITAADSAQVVKACEKEIPHSILFDSTSISGAGELFQNLEARKFRFPAVVLTNPKETREMVEIKKWKPAVFVEINSVADSMPDLIALIKKLIVFA